jgi:periplasmic protein CpxP/Spy
MKLFSLSPKSRWVLAGLVLAVTGTFALTAAAHGGFGRGGGFMGGAGLDRMAEHVLDSVNATDVQRTQVKTIVQAAANDLKAQREAHRTLRERGMQLFTQPTVDANAAEALRQQMLQQHDQMSRRVMQAMLEVSRVLTPEQRKQLAERMKQRQEMMQRHMQERQTLER